MKFALMLPTLTGWNRVDEDRNGGFRIRYERSHELCRLADSLGFDFVTLGQHRFTPADVNPSAPLTIIAALAARCERLRFCTNILILPTHDPVEIAEQTATIDEMSGGRLILGVGLGYRAYEFEQIGLNFKTRVSRMEEGIEILRRAWSDQPISFKGRHFHITGANVSPKPDQRRGPPIWVAAQVENAIMRAARLGDGWLTDNVLAASTVAPIIKRYRAEAAKFGKPGIVAMNRKVAVAPSRREVEERWLPSILAYFRLFPALGAVFEDKVFMAKLMSGQQLGLDDAPADQFIAGAPDDCIAALRQVHGVSGCDYIIADFGDGAHGQQFEDLKSAIQLFGREVMPAFR
jgi:probable F420-dependent oxidoreductase